MPLNIGGCLFFVALLLLSQDPLDATAEIEREREREMVSHGFNLCRISSMHRMTPEVWAYSPRVSASRFFRLGGSQHAGRAGDEAPGAGDESAVAAAAHGFADTGSEDGRGGEDRRAREPDPFSDRPRA